MPGKNYSRKKVNPVDSSDPEAEVEVTVEKKTKSKRRSSSSTDTSNTRSKPESDQEGKKKRLRAEIRRQETVLNSKKIEIKKAQERLNHLTNPRSSTPTNDEVTVKACKKMKKLLGAMKDAKKNKDGVIDLRRKLKDKGITEHYDEAELIAERDCYKTTLKYISEKDSDLLTQSKTKRVHRVGGTPGIGKTTFRFYLLWLWVNRKDDWLKKFDVVYFSNANWVYTITQVKDGEFGVTRAKYETILDEGQKKKGLGLLEAPKELKSIDKSLYGMEALILTGSPGRFQTGSEIYKVSPPMTCLVLWTFEEAKFLVKCKVLSNDNELEKRFETYGGVLRLLICNPIYSEGMIDEALRSVTVDFINNVMTGVTPKTTTMFVDGLVDLDESGHPQGFISKSVFDRCCTAASNRKD